MIPRDFIQELEDIFFPTRVDRGLVRKDRVNKVN